MKTEVWFQKGLRKQGLCEGQRTRLLYMIKDGRWVASFCFYNIRTPLSWPIGCFSDEHRFKTKQDLIKAMHKYDQSRGFPKAVKLGNFL